MSQNLSTDTCDMGTQPILAVKQKGGGTVFLLCTLHLEEHNAKARIPLRLHNLPCSTYD